MADSPGDEAAQRAAELSRRERDLAAHRPVTEDDVKRAAERAARARERDVEAHRRLLQRHYAAAAAHERAAEAHELALEEGLGDVAAHRLAAEREREAARRDLMTAQEAEQNPD
ncbi:hypothetical protein [Mycobacterium sp. HUMS_1102779]|uniref:hypothetical protein n=1 Tax=Mycobacterium sp. HUMS_1102779 TaxID=3383487 RepID=UPI00389992F0